ncbi:hypothetical protein ACTFIW_011477 [Dictyostelium discoideum]
MNKYTIILILLILNTLSICFGQISPAIMCFNDPSIIAIGSTCNTTGDSCAFNSYCNGAPIGKCTQSLSKGDSCTSNIQCSPYQCVNSVCGNNHFSIAGQGCSVDSDCWASPIPGQEALLTCSSNVCTLIANKQCKSPSDCKFNENCVSKGGVNSCVATSGINGACSNRYDCNVNLVCSYQSDGSTSKTCQEPWTKKLNEKCDNSPDAQRIPFFYDCDIGSNLYCGSQGKCVLNTPSGTCSQCSNSTACKGYSDSCICNNNNIAKDTINANKVGICVPEVFIDSSCKSTFGDLIQCCATNSCPMNQQLLFNQDSCAFKNCQQHVCKMSNCFRATGAYNMLNLAQTACGSTYSLPKDYTKQCPFELPKQSDRPNNSSSMIPSIFFAIFFVLTMIILS